MIIPPPIANPRLPKLGKELLNKLPQIGMREFDKECAYWMLETLNDMAYKPPINPPEEILEYRRRRGENEDYSLSRDFWTQPHIVEYKRSCDSVFCENRSNWNWLCWMEKIIPQEDELNQVKIRYAKSTYPRKGGVIVKDPQVAPLMKDWYNK